MTTIDNLALYRRYRPESFQEVVGQDHVAGPLTAALRKNRVSHAYLFSGPRGCGKTTSARILARCLNCAQGPTDVPCGECSSCVELSRNGSGSLDVVEIDAASHGGVDDARELRERATFAPVRDRYKIFIVDEAHMVTSAGFNALLKIVEEPPEHIKFIFATTEPEKVIGTIRSRTHHYPFRLVPPDVLAVYLEKLCGQEGVEYQKTALSLVIRAGGGSVRDTLSVLDQLIAGAEGGGVNYGLAVSLLGFTPAALLDGMITGITDADGAAVFGLVDKVIQSGQDPRRFVEDLLERFRDLIVASAAADHARAILRGTPPEEFGVIERQARRLRPAELSRYADVTAKALKEMTGATSPRVHVELLAARLLLPASDHTEQGFAARLDRLERLSAAMQRQGQGPPAKANEDSAEEEAGVRAVQDRKLPESTKLLGPLPAGIDPWESPTGLTPPQDRRAGAVSGVREAEVSQASAAVPRDKAFAGSDGQRQVPAQDFTEQWRQVMAVLEKIRRSTARLLDGVQAGVQEGRLVLRFGTEGLRRTFENGGNDVHVRQAVARVFGPEMPVIAVTGEAGLPANAAPEAAAAVFKAGTGTFSDPRAADTQGAVPQETAEKTMVKTIGGEEEKVPEAVAEETGRALEIQYAGDGGKTAAEEELSEADKAWLNAEPLEPDAENVGLDALAAALAPSAPSSGAAQKSGDAPVSYRRVSPAAEGRGQDCAEGPGGNGPEAEVSPDADGQLQGKAAIEKLLGGTVLEEKIIEDTGEF